MKCNFFMEYRVLQSVLCKYNYPFDKNSGLKLNINQINTQINMKQSRKPGVNELLIAKLNYCLLLHFYLFSVLLSSHYTPANVSTYQRCWHIKIHLPGLQISIGHRTMIDRNKCLTNLKLFQSDIVSKRKIKT